MKLFTDSIFARSVAMIISQITLLRYESNREYSKNFMSVKISCPIVFTIQYSTVQYSTVQYSIVQYSTVQYSTVQYSTVQYVTRAAESLGMRLLCNAT